MSQRRNDSKERSGNEEKKWYEWTNITTKKSEHETQHLISVNVRTIKMHLAFVYTASGHKFDHRRKLERADCNDR